MSFFQFFFALSVYLTMSNSEILTIPDLYTESTTRSEILHLCEGFSGGFKYTFPKLPDCPQHKNISKISKAVLVAPYWPDVQKKYPVHYCHSHGDKYQQIVNLVGTHVYTSVDLGSFNFTKSDCEKMINSHISPKGQKMTMFGDKRFATNNYNMPKGQWMMVNTEDDINYFVDTVEMEIDHISGLIITGISTLKKCNYKEGICLTADGMLLWKVPKIPPQCTIIKGKLSACLHIGDQISCPHTEFLYTGIRSKIYCGSEMVVTMTDQNVIIASVDPGILSKNSASIAEIEQYLVTGSYVSTERRKSRALEPPHVVTDIEEALKLNYLAQLIKNGHDLDIHEISTRICKEQQRTYQMVKYYAQDKQMSAIAHLITKQHGFKADLLGDVVRISECLKVDKYHFRNPGRDCTAEYPISYLVGSKEHRGFLRGLSKEIVKTPTYVHCPSPQFYFEMSGKVILLGNETDIQETKEQIKILPLNYNFTAPNGLRNITMHPLGENNLDTNFAINQINIISGLDMLDTVIANRINKFPESEQASNFFSALQNEITAPIMQYFKYFCIAFVAFAGFVVFVFILQVSEPIRECFSACLKCLTSVFLCCGRQSDKFNKGSQDLEIGIDIIKTQPMKRHDMEMVKFIANHDHCNMR